MKTPARLLQKGAKIRIRVGIPDETDQITLDGVDITRSCRAISVDMDARKPTEVRLLLLAGQIEVETIGELMPPDDSVYREV